MQNIKTNFSTSNLHITHTTCYIRNYAQKSYNKCESQNVNIAQIRGWRKLELLYKKGMFIGRNSTFIFTYLMFITHVLRLMCCSCCTLYYFPFLWKTILCLLSELFFWHSWSFNRSLFLDACIQSYLLLV